MAKNNGQAADKKPLCFVIGPIGTSGTPIRKQADLLLNLVIKEVLEKDEFGYVVRRADEDARPGMIGDRVITDVIQAALVVADLTGLNPNAFYELGIRHAALQPTIHIAQAETALPFDNIGHGTIFVDLGDFQSIVAARLQLADAARSVKEPDFKVSNPITQANASFKMRESADPRDQIISELQDRMNIIERTSLTLKSINNNHVQESIDKIRINELQQGHTMGQFIDRVMDEVDGVSTASHAVHDPREVIFSTLEGNEIVVPWGQRRTKRK